MATAAAADRRDEITGVLRATTPNCHHAAPGPPAAPPGAGSAGGLPQERLTLRRRLPPPTSSSVSSFSSSTVAALTGDDGRDDCLSRRAVREGSPAAVAGGGKESEAVPGSPEFCRGRTRNDRSGRWWGEPRRPIGRRAGQFRRFQRCSQRYSRKELDKRSGQRRGIMEDSGSDGRGQIGRWYHRLREVRWSSRHGLVGKEAGVGRQRPRRAALYAKVGTTGPMRERTGRGGGGGGGDGGRDSQMLCRSADGGAGEGGDDARVR
ncbi:unnamed protein product, partial [Lampetra fluviatilis]